MSNSSDTIKRVYELIESIKSLYRNSVNYGGDVSAEVRNALVLLDTIPPLTGTFSESGHPITKFIAHALKAGESSHHDLIEAIRPVIDSLPWKYNYPVREDAPSLGNTIAFAEIIGPEAPFVSNRVCLGLTLIAPHTLYPAHHHPAVELYYTVAGNARWSTDTSVTQNPPGRFILHPSNIIHSMETGDEPLLAVYAWTGNDVITLSAYDGKSNEHIESE